MHITEYNNLPKISLVGTGEGVSVVLLCEEARVLTQTCLYNLVSTNHLTSQSGDSNLRRTRVLTTEPARQHITFIQGKVFSVQK